MQSLEYKRQNWQHIKKKQEKQNNTKNVFNATANPLISRREDDSGAACTVNLAPILIAYYVAVAPKRLHLKLPINKSITDGTVSASWKVARVTPLCCWY